MSIGKIFIAAGTLLSFFGGEYAQAGTFLVTLGTDILAGQGTVGPIRFGNEGITATIAPWQG